MVPLYFPSAKTGWRAIKIDHCEFVWHLLVVFNHKALAISFSKMFLMRSYYLNFKHCWRSAFPRNQARSEISPLTGSCFYNGILMSITRKTNYITCSVFLCIFKGFPPLVFFEYHFLSPLSCFYCIAHLLGPSLYTKYKAQFWSLARLYLVDTISKMLKHSERESLIAHKIQLRNHHLFGERCKIITSCNKVFHWIN